MQYVTTTIKAIVRQYNSRRLKRKSSDFVHVE